MSTVHSVCGDGEVDEDEACGVAEAMLRLRGMLEDVLDALDDVLGEDQQDHGQRRCVPSSA